MRAVKVFLDENEMPRAWYNILPDLPEQLPPPINPATKEPVNPKDLEGIFGKELVRQEISSDRWISIPEEVLEIYKIWRPTPLIRARNLEKALKTPAKIYYKWEGVSPPGSHKPNTAVAQAYYLAKQGFKRAATETGAGQWGSSLAFGCAFFDLEATVYMVRASYKQKPYRRILMQLYGATVYPSPSDRTDVGKKFLETNPEHPGSLGIAISEAIEDVVKHQDEARYSLGSVVNHVLLHQTIIGLEAIKQFASIDDYPDVITGCIGGGSSFSGTFFPFYHERFISKKAKKEVRFIAAEPSACPSITKGVYTYDHGDTAMLTPLLKMHTLGHDFVPPPIHAGGLRYHGMAPSLCLLANKGIVEARAYNQREVFEAASLFTKTEGTVLAPETAHGLKAAIDQAIECRKKNESKTILFVGSGHGHFDMQAYADYLESKLPAYEYPKEEIEKSIKKLRELYPELVK